MSNVNNISRPSAPQPKVKTTVVRQGKVGKIRTGGKSPYGGR